MLASVPLIQPIALGDAPIQTVSVRDLSAVVLDAIEGRLPSHEAFDVVEKSPHSLREVIGEFRRWLGFERARMEMAIPGFVLSAVAKAADALGYLGWRSPLRTTTIQVLAEGVLGDSRGFSQIDSRKLSSLQQTLDNLPSTLQERWFARLYLLMPVTIAVLAAFWVLTGLIALLNFNEAIRMSGLSEVTSRVAVVSGSVVDMTLGGAILYRPWSKMACWGMATVTSVYIVVGSAFRPDLWSDPLGPLLKAVPILVLVLVAALLVDDR
jgi:DoxX-like family